MQAYRDAAKQVLEDPLILDEHKPEVHPLQFAMMAAQATAEWIEKHQEGE
ncbi:MAG: hypothetical protein L0J69_00140 [Yaniella sp.]|nr:hypothetical protein [Yaniella sp.]